MIVGAIVTALLASLDALVSLLPVITLPVMTTASGILNAVQQAATILPVDQLVLALGAVLAVRVALSLWDLGVWVYHQIWGSD